MSTIEISTDKLATAAAEKEKAAREEIMNYLAAASGSLLSEANGLAFHPARPGSPIVSVQEGTDPARAAKWLNGYLVAQSEEAVFQLPPTIKCRPWDGAVNVNDLLQKIYGVGAQGLAQRSFFGTTPPQEIPVETGYGQHRSVPFGLVDLPDFEGEMYLGQKEDPEFGLLFDMHIKCPKKYKQAVDGLFKQLGDHIKLHSIYKGKAIVGAGRTNDKGKFEHPQFINPFQVDPNKVAYNSTVFEQLRASVWGPIRTAALQRKAGLKLNRKTLLYGDYGTGKTLAGNLTARVAVNNGWTFIQAKTGDKGENIGKVLKTAELYAPAVVFIEDIDTLVEQDPREMSKILEMFDGVSSKGKEVMILMTSNHIKALSKGMTRVGRMDAAIEIGQLDTPAVERFIKSSFELQMPYDGARDNGVYEAMSKELAPEDLEFPDTMLSPDLDFEEVQTHTAGFSPAFIAGTFDLTKSNAIVREESLNFRLRTVDFVIAADTLRSLHDTHTNAADRPAVETFGVAMQEVVERGVEQAIRGHRVDFSDKGDIIPVPVS